MAGCAPFPLAAGIAPLPRVAQLKRGARNARQGITRARSAPELRRKPIGKLRYHSRHRAAHVASANPGGDSDIDTPTISSTNDAGPSKVDETAKAGPSNRSLRITTGLALGAVGMIGVLAGGYIFTGLIAFTCVIGIREFFGMVSAKGQVGGTRIIAVCCALFPLFAQLAPYKGFRLMLPVAAMSICTYLLLQSNNKKHTMYTFSTAIFGLFYMAYLPSFWVRLRGISSPSGLSFQNEWPIVLGGPEQLTLGLAVLLGSILCIISADSFAYIVGKAIGKTKLTAVSPNKTVEGALGGYTGCIAVALMMSSQMNWPYWGATGLVFGSVIFFSSLFGDLTESVMKRDAGIKDSGNFLPGHGGILDRFDSYICTAPLVYYFVRLLLLPLMGINL